MAIYAFVTQRVVNDGVNSSTWNYNPQGAAITVTDPLGNDTVYSPWAPASCGTTSIKYYSGSAASGSLVKTVTKSYTDLPDPYIGEMGTAGYACPPALPSGTVTAWANGQQNQVSLTYDSGYTFTDTNPNGQGTKKYTSSYGLVTSESHSDFYTGSPTSPPLLSTTTTNYMALTNSSYATANILDLPSSVTITDGSGNKCDETDYGYDESTADPSGVTEQHVTAPNSVVGILHPSRGSFLRIHVQRQPRR